MQHTNIPQDPSALQHITKELCYAKNEDGSYATFASSGWEVKSTALDVAWDDIEETISKARNLAHQGKRSPLYVYMHKHMMTIGLLANYTRISRIRVWLHMYPFWFKRISTKHLETYASLFDIATVDLHQIP